MRTFSRPTPPAYYTLVTAKYAHRRRRASSLALAILIALVAAVPATAQRSSAIPNENDVIPVDSPAYDLLAATYLDAGLALPSQSQPYSRAEFSRSLERLERALAAGRRLSPAGENAYAELRRLLDRQALYAEPTAGARTGTQPRPAGDERESGDSVSDSQAGEARESGASLDPDGFYFAFTPEASLELRGHLPLWASPAVGGAGSPGYFAEHDYQARQALVHLPFETWMLGSLYAALEFDLKQEYRTVDGRFGDAAPSGGGANPTNIPINPLELDLRIPLRSFLAVGGDHWMVQFGREQVSWGPGRTGNLMVSDYNDYLEALQFRTWWNAFKFAALYAVADARTAGSSTTDPDRYWGVAAHRLEFRVAEVVQLAFSEAMTFANTYPELIRELNPIMIYHNWHLSTERVSSMLSAEVDATPIPGLNLWGQFAMNEFETPAETEAAGGGVANGVTAIAGMLGAEYQHPIGAGFLRGGYEWALLYPWFPHHPNAPFEYQTVYWSFLDPAQLGLIAKPLGYFTGPDSLTHTGWIAYEVPGSWQADLRVQHVARGEIDFDTPYPDPPTAEMRADATPTGAAEFRTTAAVGGTYHALRPWSFGSRLYLVYTENEHNVPDADRLDLEWSIHGTWSW